MNRVGPDQNFASARGCMAIAATARISGVPDHLEIATAAAESILTLQSVSPTLYMCANTGLALLAVHNGNQPAAEEQYDFLVKQRGR